MGDSWTSAAIDAARDRAAELFDAQKQGLLFVAEGDDGGQTFFTIPSNQIRCSQDDLVRLVFEIDYLHWNNPGGVKLSYNAIEVGKRFGGGMGGALATGSLWVHEVLAGSQLACRIDEVLKGLRTSLWPSGSTEIGKPLEALEILDLLETERIEAPVYDLIRAAEREAGETKSGRYSNRLAMALRRFLFAEDHRNRIEAAKYLVNAVESGLIVSALYPAASGEAKLESRGWQGHAVQLLSVLAKQGSNAAYEALRVASASDSWIAEAGAYVFSPQMGDAHRKYFEPNAFRSEFARVFDRSEQPDVSLEHLPSEEVDALFGLAQDLLRQKRRDEAEVILMRFSRELPTYDHGMVWYELAELLELKSEIAAADRAYTRALECEASSIYLLAYGTFLWRHNNSAKALQTFKNLRRLIDEGMTTSPIAIDPIVEALESGGDYRVFARQWKWHSLPDPKELPGPTL